MANHKVRRTWGPENNYLWKDKVEKKKSFYANKAEYKLT